MADWLTQRRYSSLETVYRRHAHVVYTERWSFKSEASTGDWTAKTPSHRPHTMPSSSLDLAAHVLLIVSAPRCDAVPAYTKHFTKWWFQVLLSLTLYDYEHIKTAEQRTIYINTVIGTLAIDGWAVTFGTTRRGLGGLRARPVPSSLYQM